MTRWLAGVVVLVQPVILAAQQPYAPLLDGILGAWDRADVVCLGERHAGRRDSDLRVALVRDPRFARTVDVIVIEFANPAHQDLLDLFVLEGAELSRAQLAIVWRDASSPETWESPVYEAFLRAVRAVNLSLPPDDRVRVIGGDAAIPWATINTAEQLVPFMNRGKVIRDAIGHEVLERGLKALAIFGTGHCVNVGMGFPGELEPRYPGRFWSVYTFADSVAEVAGRARFGLGDAPAYVVVRGSGHAAWPAAGLFLTDPRHPTTIGQMLDAIVWFGSEPDRIVRSTDRWPDADARRELERRVRLLQAAAALLYGRR